MSGSQWTKLATEGLPPQRPPSVVGHGYRSQDRVQQNLKPPGVVGRPDHNQFHGHIRARDRSGIPICVRIIIYNNIIHRYVII